MAKSLSEEKTKKTISFLEQTLVPKIKKLVDTANVFLEKKGIRVGLELQWFLDDISDEKEDEVHG